MEATKKLGKAIWEILGRRKGPDVVFEHIGQETFPTSVFLAGRMGRIVICGATSGYELSFDTRYLWMRQKTILGSHFANAEECGRANLLVQQGKIRPIVTEVYEYARIPDAHQKMLENRHMGTLSCLVGAPRAGLENFAETRR